MNYAFGVLMVGMPLALSSCVYDDQPDLGPKEVVFSASLGKDGIVSTRALGEYKPVTAQVYGDEPFYIYTKAATGNEVVWPYKVAAGQLGKLTPKNDIDRLNWYSPTTEHTFTGWTMPWQEDTWKVGDNTETTVWFLASEYEKMGVGPDSAMNCRLLERFVGAKTPALSYESNGEIVEMYYQHLVSKIHIDPLILIENDGTMLQGLEAVMTFYQLPQYATFDRIPLNDAAPKVIKDPNAPTGISCNIRSNTTLWVCPEMDFSKMQFSIHINDSIKGNSDYFGDFRAVTFTRDPNEPWDEGKSPTVLYAGEEMTLRLTVRDGNEGAFVSVNIAPWSDQEWRNASSFARKGIYNNTELEDFYKKFSTAGGGYSEENIREMFEKFGQTVEKEDGTTEEVVYLYDDVSTSHRQMPFPSGDMILDGADHTITQPKWQMKISFPGSEEQTVCDVCRVCNCRNVYITNGDSTIYIDGDGNIFLFNAETFVLTPTPYKLPPEGQQFSNSRVNYYIDFKTGFCSYYATSLESGS